MAMRCAGRIRGSGRLSLDRCTALAFRRQARSRSRSANCARASKAASTSTARSTGTGLTADAPWTARLTSLSGTHVQPAAHRARRNRAPRGHVRIAQRARRQRRIARRRERPRRHLGAGSRAGMSNLRSLAFVQRGMQGQLVSNGHARGTPAQPEADRPGAPGRSSRSPASTLRTPTSNADVDASDQRRSKRCARVDRHRRPAAMNFQSMRLRHRRLQPRPQPHARIRLAGRSGPQHRAVPAAAFAPRARSTSRASHGKATSSEAAVQFADGAATSDPTGRAGAEPGRCSAPRRCACAPATMRDCASKASTRRKPLVVARHLQRAGLAAEAPAALAAGLARIRRAPAGERLGRAERRARTGSAARRCCSTSRPSTCRATSSAPSASSSAAAASILFAEADAMRASARFHGRRDHAGQGRGAGDARTRAPARIRRCRAASAARPKRSRCCRSGAGDRSCRGQARRRASTLGRHAWASRIQRRFPPARRPSRAVSHESRHLESAGRRQVRRRPTHLRRARRHGRAAS